MPSPGTVIAVLALLAVVGGTAYAASNLPARSVGRRQLKKGAVTKPKIAKKTFAALHGAKGATGPRGATGPKGTTGPQGPGASSFDASVPADAQQHELMTVGGIHLTEACFPNPSGQVNLHFKSAQNFATMDITGTDSTFNNQNVTGVFGVDKSATNEVALGSAGGAPTDTHSLDADVIARDTSVTNKFTRFDVHVDSPACTAWGMITPSG
jgi:hypothetical protein